MNVFRPVKLAFPEIKQSQKVPFLLKTEHDLSFIEIPGALSGARVLCRLCGAYRMWGQTAKHRCVS